MSVPRSFDYDDAKRRYQAGERVADLAAEYGVSATAVYRAVNDEYRARIAARGAEWVAAGTCVDCGASCTRRGRTPLCRACSAKRRVTSVRETELRCATCDEWKPDAAFPKGTASPLRRGKHQTCSACHTAIKRAYRDAHKQPCSHGCGTLVDTVDRRNPDKPLECRSCAMRRVHSERKAAA